MNVTRLTMQKSFKLDQTFMNNVEKTSQNIENQKKNNVHEVYCTDATCTSKIGVRRLLAVRRRTKSITRGN